MKPRASALALTLLLSGGALRAQDWSPTAATVVFTSTRGGSSDLWIQHGSSEATPLTDHSAQDHAAAWFPDGRRVVFQSLRDGQREIYAVDTDDGGLVRITDHPAQDLLPSVSPDGDRIVFFSDRGLDHGPRELPGHLYLLDLRSGDTERLTEEPLTSTFGGTWSPDGRTILFARDFGGDIDLVLLDLETNAERRLASPGADEYGGRFSPDGDSIAFHADSRDGESRIVLMAVDGGARREITAGGQHYGPSWSPDGRWLLFTAAPLGSSDFDALAVRAEGGEPIPVAASPHDDRAASWCPRP